MRQTLVFSDLHLSPRAPGDGAWMRFRQRSFFADDAFASLVEQLLGRLGNAPLEVVFNGDTFELDGAAAWSSGPRAPDEDQGNEGSEAANLERILDDHPAIVQAMGRLLERAERLVFVSGNHDQGLYFPEVQRRLRARLVAAALAPSCGPPDPALSERVVFRPWFHRTADGLHVEHAHQLDPDSAVPDPLLPLRPDGEGLWLSLGSAGLRHILGGIGTMNPHVPGSFRMGGVLDYLGHYARYYLLAGRPLVSTWAFGAIRCARHVLVQERQASSLPVSRRLDALAEQAKVTGLSARQVRSLCELRVRRSSERPFTVWRTLWLDRLAFLSGGLILGSAGVLLGTWALGLVALALLVTAYLVYEHLVADEPADAYESSIPWAANRMAAISEAPVVLLAHTHGPLREPLPGGALLVNTGSWAPAFGDAECRVPVRQDRTFAWVLTDGARVVSARLLAFKHQKIVAFDGALLPDLEGRAKGTGLARAA